MASSLSGRVCECTTQTVVRLCEGIIAIEARRRCAKRNKKGNSW